MSESSTAASTAVRPMLEGEGLVKTYGRIVALDGTDFALFPGEVLAVIGDNGAGKSTLIKCLSGAEIPNEGVMRLDGQVIQFRTPIEARRAGIETVHQTLAVGPPVDVASSPFLGRQLLKPGPLGRLLRALDGIKTSRRAKGQMVTSSIATLQRMGQAVSKVVILDEPTTALGVRESTQVLKLISSLRERGMPVILISHKMAHVFQVADRIHVQRLGRRAAVITPQSASIADVMAMMRGALQVDVKDQALTPVR